MNPLTADGLIGYAEYETQREEFRRRIIALKQARRVTVGPKLSLVFENRETLQFQVQEMIRAERIVDPRKIQEELDVYNALLPEVGELSATLFIEITDSDDIKRDLDAFMGIDHGQTLALVADGQVVHGVFEGGHSNEEKISAVHFVRFHPTTAWRQAVARADAPVVIRVAHRGYRAECVAPSALRLEWLADLATP